MAKRDRAAYMREYRAKKRESLTTTIPMWDAQPGEIVTVFDRPYRVAKRVMTPQNDPKLGPLTGYKVELELRPLDEPREAVRGVTFNTRPFTPVPKK
jgi:hypothetical protein